MGGEEQSDQQPDAAKEPSPQLEAGSDEAGRALSHPRSERGWAAGGVLVGGVEVGRFQGEEHFRVRRPRSARKEEVAQRAALVGVAVVLLPLLLMYCLHRIGRAIGDELERQRNQ